MKSQEDTKEVQIHGNHGLIVLNHVGKEYKLEQDQHSVPRKQKMVVIRRNHPNHATLSHVHIIKGNREKIQRRFIGEIDKNLEAEKEGQKEGWAEAVEARGVEKRSLEKKNIKT